jgi:hypothetical protein
MLEKSNKGSIVMSGIAISSILITSLLLEYIRLSLGINIISGFQAINIGWTEVLQAILIFIILFIIFVLPFALLIHNWNRFYFGKSGAMRWVLFGIIFGCIAQLGLLIQSIIPGESILKFGINLGFGLLTFYISRLIAFIIPQRFISK